MGANEISLAYLPVRFTLRNHHDPFFHTDRDFAVEELHVRKCKCFHCATAAFQRFEILQIVR